VFGASGSWQQFYWKTIREDTAVCSAADKGSWYALGGSPFKWPYPPRYLLGNLAISVEHFQLERFHAYSYQTSISTNRHVRNNLLLWLSSFLYSTPGAYCRARRAPRVLPSQSQVLIGRGRCPCGCWSQPADHTIPLLDEASYMKTSQHSVVRGWTVDPVGGRLKFPCLKVYTFEPSLKNIDTQVSTN